MKCFIYFLFLLSSLYGDAFEEGIELSKQKEYAQAAHHFHDAAESGNAAALFGEIVCKIALGEKRLEDLSCPSCHEETTFPPMAKEPASAYNCRRRVRKVALKLRNLVERIVADTVPGLVKKIQTFRQLNPYIDRLQRNGLACCQNNTNEEDCTEPLVEQLKLWNSEGLPKR